MEWLMLFVAGVVATAAVAGTHELRRHAHPQAAAMVVDQRLAAARAIRAVEDDVEAARLAAEKLSLEQRPRG
jgi:hypothetical protein